MVFWKVGTAYRILSRLKIDVLPRSLIASTRCFTPYLQELPVHILPPIVNPRPPGSWQPYFGSDSDQIEMTLVCVPQVSTCHPKVLDWIYSRGVFAFLFATGVSSCCVFVALMQILCIQGTGLCLNKPRTTIAREGVPSGCICMGLVPSLMPSIVPSLMPSTVRTRILPWRSSCVSRMRLATLAHSELSVSRPRCR